MKIITPERVEYRLKETGTIWQQTTDRSSLYLDAIALVDGGIIPDLGATLHCKLDAGENSRDNVTMIVLGYILPSNGPIEVDVFLKIHARET